MKNRNLFVFLIFCCALISLPSDAIGQCTGCSANKSYTGGNSVVNSWVPSGNPTSSTIARFGTTGNYVWNASANNSVYLSGIILGQNVNLEVGRSNNNEVTAFDIVGGCIIVGANSTLTFSFFTKMENITICVEPGGKLIYSSDATGGSEGQRDDFNFNNVTINLSDATSTIEFGDADIIVGSGGLEITGWTGSVVCTGSSPPSTSGSSGNISWTSETNICEVLNGRILPVEFLSFDVAHQPQDRIAKLNWQTAKEWENSHFEIERAINTVKEWETIGQVKGLGYSEIPLAYNFTDSSLPKSGGNIFYRLKQVDFSGKFSYSRTKGIQIKASEGNTAWSAYPNPSRIGSEITVELKNLNQYKDEIIYLKIGNILGEGETQRLSSPEEVSQFISHWFRDKSTGLYTLDITWGEQSQQIKLLRN